MADLQGALNDVYESVGHASDIGEVGQLRLQNLIVSIGLPVDGHTDSNAFAKAVVTNTGQRVLRWVLVA